MFDMRREHQLILDIVIEAAYVLDGLPDRECIARCGRTKEDMQSFIDAWRDFEEVRTVAVGDLEFVKSCFFEVLDFFSAEEFKVRTGWGREDGRLLFEKILERRREITIRRLWGGE